MPDKVDQVWTYNGTIKYRSKMNQVCTVRYEDFEKWLWYVLNTAVKQFVCSSWTCTCKSKYVKINS